MPFQISNEEAMSDKDKEINQEAITDKEGADGEKDREEEAVEKTPEKIIEELEEKIKKQEDRYLRLVAEFDNYKKRNARLYDSMVQSAREGMMSPLLEVVDNFERALESSEDSDIKSFKKGTRLIYEQLNELLRKEGVEPIEAVGAEFNPNLHEAMMQVESDEYPEGIIVGEVIRGYKLRDKVIRFSKVTVSKGSGKENDKDKE